MSMAENDYFGLINVDKDIPNSRRTNVYSIGMTKEELSSKGIINFNEIQKKHNFVDKEDVITYQTVRLITVKDAIKILECDPDLFWEKAEECVVEVYIDGKFSLHVILEQLPHIHNSKIGNWVMLHDFGYNRPAKISADCDD